jgi:hypothetical protein
MVALALAVVACRRSHGSGAAPATSASPAVEAVTLRVDNHFRADIAIFVQRGSVRSRLGTVVTAATVTFRVPPTYVGDTGGFYLIADPVGASGIRSERIIVRGGERITWSLESDLARSTLGIF